MVPARGVLYKPAEPQRGCQAAARTLSATRLQGPAPRVPDRGVGSQGGCASGCRWIYQYNGSFRAQPQGLPTGAQKEGEGGMIIWGIFWGAVLGSWFGGYGDFGPFVGGILGFFAGLSLRWAIRSAIRTELQAHATKATAQPTRAPQAAPVAEDRSVAAPPMAQGPVPPAPPLRPAADHQQAGAIRLRRGQRHCRADAGDFFCAAAGDQPDSVVGQPPPREIMRPGRLPAPQIRPRLAKEAVFM